MTKSKTPYWPQMVEVWFQFHIYHEGFEPTFEEGAPPALKKICDKLRKRTEKSGQQWDEENAISTLNWFLLLSRKDKFTKENLLLPIINQRFDKILSYGINNQERNGNFDAREGLEYLSAMF